jgi:predicted acetyltransferase
MPISIRDVKRQSADRKWIQNVYSEYLDDLSGQNTGLFPMVGEHGARDDELFANWFSNDKAHPLIILQGKEYVGFALVTRVRSRDVNTSGADFRMSEFFVRKPHRRHGIGRDASTIIFNRFSGNWEIIEYVRNAGALAFWRRVVASYSKGKFSEQVRDGVVHHRFKSQAK